MEPKKISFGFMKTKKTEKPVEEEKKDYIECVEEKAIKVVGGDSIEEVKPLVIPMKPNTLITAERLREIADKVEQEITEEPQPQIKSEPPEEKPSENETLDQMAIRELLQDAKKEVKIENAEFTVPIPAKPVMDGEKESTLEDYESVPIQDFGMAMLRGMGWTPNKDGSKYKLPELRPKGLGLGADKVIKDNQKKNVSKGPQSKDEELAIIKNSFVKIVTGKYSGCYGKVMSLDEDNGRVMVDIPIKKQTVSLSEFMMQPVTKAEFHREARVINQDTYEEYKKKEVSQKSSSSRNESSNEPSSSKSDDLNDYRRGRNDKYKETERDNRRRDDKSSNGRNRRKNRDSSSEERVRRSKRDSSSEERVRRSKRDSSSEERVRKNKRDSSSEERVRKNKRDSSSEDRSSRRKEQKKYRSSESLDSLSNEKKRRHKSSRKKSSSDSDDLKKSRHRSRTPDGKRDIDKKRKGKKKRRDRDRSPNYRKHRK